MDITISPRKLHGEIAAIASKSQAHRVLICAAFADRETRIICHETNRDMDATAQCLQQMGRGVSKTEYGYRVCPQEHREVNGTVYLSCGESGSTLRFLLPIAGALGLDAVFLPEGRLPERPLSPLWEEMERMGCRLQILPGKRLSCKGKLQPGVFRLSGGVSSQFITGLLFAASLLPASSEIQIEGRLESAPYVEMTQRAMALFGIDTQGLRVKGGQTYRSPGQIEIEGDWSNGAFFLGAAALGSEVTVTGLQPDSPQGDRAAKPLMRALREGFCQISAEDIPDLVPILSVVAAANHGAVFTKIQRLRLKESDRVESTLAMLRALGIAAESAESTLTVHPGKFTGGTVDSRNDHRIAMSAAIAATEAHGPVTVLGAQCVEKSYPGFWDDYKQLGGCYELNIR